MICIENGMMSYENPNYHMDPQRLERNSHLYEEILSELQQQNSLRTAVGGDVGLVGVEQMLINRKTGQNHVIGNNRKDYARLDIGSMGVDLKENFR